jgi:diguanylate cyclase (GGDEF)-like protein
MINRHLRGGTVNFCIFLVLTTLVGGSWFVLERTRQTALNAASTTLQNAALVVESAVNRELLQVDGALASLPVLLTTVTKDSQDLDAQTTRRLLRGLNFQTFAFRDIIMLRPDGGIWASARPNSWNGSIAGAALGEDSASADGTARVAGPLRNPVTGDWTLLVVRQLAVPGAGVLTAVAEVPLPRITVLFSAFGDIPGLRISLERRNGQLIVSQPYNETQIGVVQPVAVSQIEATGAAFMVPSKLMRTPTIGVVRTSLYPDVMIALTLDLDAAMADWVRDRNRLMAVVTIAVGLLSALAVSLRAARRERERADAERSKARRMLDSAIESMSDGFVMWDSEDRLITCNEQFRQMYRVSNALIRPGAGFEQIIRGGALLGQYPQAADDIEAFVQETMSWRRSNRGPMERQLPDGRWALITERKTPDGGTVGIRTDITDIKKAMSDIEAANARALHAMEEVQAQNLTLRERDRALHIQNVLFDAALNNMSQGLLMIDQNHRLIVYNQRFLALFGLDEASFSVGLPVDDIFAKMEAVDGLTAALVEKIYHEQRSFTDARQSGAFVASGEAGQAIAVSQRPIADGGWVATYEDVSDQRRAEEHIRFAAHHDALTKLPNRVLFRMRLDEMIGNPVYRETGLAVLFLDLDRFKQVNDTLGHSIGDALLEAAGRRLLGCLRANDIVARLGGDEFAIAHVATNMPDAARQLSERIIAEISEPYELGGHRVIVGASIGIALAGNEPMDADTLLKNADMALYQAKSKGRGVYSLFKADMERQLLSRLAIEEDLRGALSRQEFELLYQPLWDLGSNRITGFEALIRWNHPVRGIVSPIHFIQIAEETGLIRAIGEWVVQRACADAMQFPGDIRIAVNLSASQFNTSDIVDIVAAALESSRLPARRLELEITETTLLTNNEATLALLFRLRALGLRIALDDFGTGYSSLTYLRIFPFDKIKIDQSFVREMATRVDCAAIVSSIVELANKLNITTTAEGIETLDQLALVREAGCTEAQGYLFSVPRSLAGALGYFEESAGSVAPDHSVATPVA